MIRVLQVLVIFGLVFNQLLASAHGHGSVDHNEPLHVELAHVHLGHTHAGHTGTGHTGTGHTKTDRTKVAHAHTGHAHTGHAHHDRSAQKRINGHTSTEIDDKGVAVKQTVCGCRAPEDSQCCIIIPVSTVTGQMVEPFQLEADCWCYAQVEDVSSIGLMYDAVNSSLLNGQLIDRWRAMSPDFTYLGASTRLIRHCRLQL